MSFFDSAFFSPAFFDAAEETTNDPLPRPILNKGIVLVPLTTFEMVGVQPPVYGLSADSHPTYGLYPL